MVLDPILVCSLSLLVSVSSIIVGVILRWIALTFASDTTSPLLNSFRFGNRLSFLFLESAIAILSYVIVYKIGLSFISLSLLLMTRILFVLSLIDICEKLLPDTLTLPLLWLGLILNSHDYFSDLKSAVWGAVAGYMLLWTMYWVYKIFTGKEGIGYGDFKLLAAIGAWGGVTILPSTLLYASILAVIVSLLLSPFTKNMPHSYVAFGPYLAAAGWLNIVINL